MSKPIILCVDDEKTILESLKQHFRQTFGKTYRYEFAENADEAMELIDEFKTEIRVIISDWLMPGKKGDEFLIEVHNTYPKMVKIMLTAQADDEAIERAKKQANLHCCLPKPWQEKELVDALNSALKMSV